MAIVSPSSALAGEFPHVHELGLQRLRDAFDLEPVEYPTTRTPGSPEERARDLMDAFTDPTIAAVMATIGGDDQITVLRHLDMDLVGSHPKRFFGYSDNTNFLNALVHSGVVGFHGGSTMVHLGRPGGLHPTTERSLRSAIFGVQHFAIEPAERFANHPLAWTDPANLERTQPMRRASPWEWSGASGRISARLWGGCLEILDWTAQVGRWIAPAEHYAGSVLFIETSEEHPSAEYVFRTLRNLGERGVLGVLAGVLAARPNSEPMGESRSDDEVRGYEREQAVAVRRAVETYNPGALVVTGLEAGHTDPQVILPLGGVVDIDGDDHTIHVRY